MLKKFKNILGGWMNVIETKSVIASNKATLGSEFNEEVHNGIKSITTFNREYRGVKPDTSKYFGVRYECSQETGEVVSSYYPITKGVMEGVAISDAITGYKIRKHPKVFSAVGDVGNDSLGGVY